MRLAPLLWLIAAAPGLTGCICGSVTPPQSQLPNAAAALSRMRASAACGNGIQASAKIDQFGAGGRVRGELLMFVHRPEKLRMDVLAPPPVMAPIATLTSDGERFALADLREKKFFVGAASACNIARLTTVPMPAHVLVDLLRGQAPVLKHEPTAATIAWDNDGYYVVTLPSTRDAVETLKIAPRKEDWNLPWEKQQMRVLDVLVKQYGRVLYHAELEGHAKTAMAAPRVDKDGIDPDVPPSGPHCEAEVPRKIHVEVPGRDQDVQFRYDQLTWNPPLLEGTFVQPPPAGMPIVPVRCD